MKSIHSSIILLLTLGTLFAACTPGDSFSIKQNEKIVFLGNAFFENAIDKGEIETTISLCYPKKNITFRNIGWSGDNVYAHTRTRARGGGRFGDPDKGFGILTNQIIDLKPDKIFIAYGFNESFDDEGGIDSYGEGLNQLLEMLSQHCPELILISTIPMETGFGIPSEHIEAQNEKLKNYAEMTKDIAINRGHSYVDLFTPLSKESKYTANGIHLTANGYRKAGELIAQALSFPAPAIEIDSEKAAQIRNTIIKKNTLFFHRWRPRNDAFVYGERKDEQRIAQEEPAQIEPFIAKQEAAITLLLEDL
ncbi:GDSL-type esterase/lipase family protein [Cyclobacterium sp.]|uniref:GDSL-type esterase/lipase family protein n=1 Tax=Cyclobacterium sp. TaxID=1966343 RepID=UPI0025C69E6D|nr:GDSL-type esterase/lipase family protein [Cyclobacterium sp.]